MKFLVVGIGSIGMRHAKNLMDMGHEVYCFDTDKSKYEEIPGWDSDPDIIADIICTPTVEHGRDIWRAANRGRHIFVEKPIAASYEDKLLRDGIMMARDKKLVVMVGNMLRFHPNVRMAKLLIKRPKAALFRVLQKSDKPAYRRDGVLLNWGAHEIDLALHLLGPGKVQDAEQTEERDSACVRLIHDNGAVSDIQMDYRTEPEVRDFYIEEESGDIHEINLTLHDWNQIYIDEMQAFIDRINGKETLGATADDGLATLRLINDAERMTAK